MRNEFWLLGIIPVGLIAWIFTRPTISKEYLGKLPRNGRNAIRDLSKITGITVHWTATPKTTSIESIARYHVENNGWPNIGYHVVIKNGRAYWTNDLEERGYHNGFNNTASVGVSIVANETDQPSQEDIRKLYQVVNLLRNDKRMNIKNLSSHSEIPGASTTCPGDIIRSEVLNMRKIWGLGKIGLSNLVASPMNRTETDVYSSEFADN